jgi:hypothetical protein
MLVLLCHYAPDMAWLTRWPEIADLSSGGQKTSGFTTQVARRLLSALPVNSRRHVQRLGARPPEGVAWYCDCALLGGLAPLEVFQERGKSPKGSCLLSRVQKPQQCVPSARTLPGDHGCASVSCGEIRAWTPIASKALPAYNHSKTPTQVGWSTFPVGDPTLGDARLVPYSRGLTRTGKGQRLASDPLIRVRRFPFRSRLP